MNNPADVRILRPGTLCPPLSEARLGQVRTRCFVPSWFWGQRLSGSFPDCGPRPPGAASRSGTAGEGECSSPKAHHGLSSAAAERTVACNSNQIYLRGESLSCFILVKCPLGEDKSTLRTRLTKTY